MASEDTGRQLSTIIAILKLANRDQIDAARTSIRSDKVNAAILDAAKRWTGAGKVQTMVSKKTSASRSTITARLGELMALGVLEKQGGGPTTEYRATGLI
jgi:Fic family protein